MQALVRCEEATADLLGLLLPGDLVHIVFEFAQFAEDELRQYIVDAYRVLKYSDKVYDALLVDLSLVMTLAEATQLAGYSGKCTERDWRTMKTSGGYRGKRGIWNDIFRNKKGLA